MYAEIAGWHGHLVQAKQCRSINGPRWFSVDGEHPPAFPDLGTEKWGARRQG